MTELQYVLLSYQKVNKIGNFEEKITVRVFQHLKLYALHIAYQAYITNLAY